MCIIHYFPQSIALNIEGLKNGAQTNDDGHGWAVASDQGIERGGSMNFLEALDAVVDARARHGSRSAVVFHSRWATHGEFGEFNIHPFWVGDGQDTIMAHNGVLPSYLHPTEGDRRSDTRIFVDRVAPHFARNGNPSRRQGGQLAQMIGSGNKLVFMSVATGQVKTRIVNQSAGIWDGGAWYSNDAYLPSKWAWRNSFASSGSLWSDEEWIQDGWTKDPITKAWTYNEDADERRRYYEDEVSGMLVDRVTGEYVCWYCEGPVDTAANYCSDCDRCQDCFEEARDCMCYTPAVLQRGRAMALIGVEV